METAHGESVFNEDGTRNRIKTQRLFFSHETGEG